MKAVGYRKSLPVEASDSLIDFETAKPEPKAGMGRLFGRGR